MSSIRIFSLSLLVLTGCTVVQQPVASVPAAGYDRAIDVADGKILPQALKDRYDALARLYGAANYANGAPVFIPAVKPGDGCVKLPDGTWHMTFAASENFDLMSRLAKQAFQPGN